MKVVIGPRHDEQLNILMVLWEIRSYPEALGRERERTLARTELQDRYGRLWPWKATRRWR